MDNFDIIQSKIYKRQVEFEDYEADYRKAQKKLEEDYQDADALHSAIRQLADQKIDVFYGIAQQGDFDLEQARSHFFDFLDHVVNEAETGLIRKRYDLDGEVDNLEQTYKKAYRKYEDDLEALIIERRKAFEEEENAKKLGV